MFVQEVLVTRARHSQIAGEKSALGFIFSQSKEEDHHRVAARVDGTATAAAAAAAAACEQTGLGQAACLQRCLFRQDLQAMNS